MKNMIDNNQVQIVGEFISGFEYSHNIYGESFYTSNFRVERISHNVDIIPVMISDRLIDINDDLIGRTVNVSGQFRSYNKFIDGKNKLILSVFVREIEDTDKHDFNQIILDGYICKLPIYRITPLGREIADVLLAINRPYGKTDYIPCVAWGRNARCVNKLNIGTRICINGRIQSREYTKKLPGIQYKKRVAYEVSIRDMEEVNGE